MLAYLVLCAQKTMRDIKLPSAVSYWNRIWGIYRRRLIVEDTF